MRVSTFLICIIIFISYVESNNIIDLRWSPEDCLNHKNTIRMTTPTYYTNNSLNVVLSKYNRGGRARFFQHAIAHPNGEIEKRSEYESIYTWDINSSSIFKTVKCDSGYTLCLEDSSSTYEFSEVLFESTLYHWVSGIRQLYNIDDNYNLTVWDMSSKLLILTQDLSEILDEDYLEGTVLHNSQLMHIIIPFKDKKGNRCDVGGYYFIYDHLKGLKPIKEVPYVDSAMYDPFASKFFVTNNNTATVYNVEVIDSSYEFTLTSNVTFNESQLVEVMDRTAMKYWLGPLLAFIILWILLSVISTSLNS